MIVNTYTSYRSFPRCRCDFPRLRLSIGFLDYIKPSTLEIYTNDRRDIFLNNGVCIFDQYIVIFWLWSKIASDGRQRKFEKSDGQGKSEVSSVEEGTGALPGLPRGVLAVPLGSAVVFTPSASVFPPPKYGRVTGIHWMDCMSIVVDFSDNFVVVMHLPFSRSLVNILCIFTFSCF